MSLQPECPVINYCLSNIDEVTRTLLRRSEFEVVEDFCLNRCGTCYEGPFLVVEGRLFTGESHQAILEQVKSLAHPVGKNGQVW
jgi:uncharacterized protein YuzB (UPF0349 family)